ncbi:hypothetical protein [Azospirillum griseum]|uniref:Uncharacterized protein n=1 Tax=Azospirillum griseum TaxID=2496639 RepID=A0A431VNL9_9PROT|nr:hypothetical protein [Azospirillum griseum]RTR24362.1 hypothetical protein EJ903_00885 [Azospirillum griseum]
MQVSGYASYATNPYAQTRASSRTSSTAAGTTDESASGSSASKTSAADAFLAEARKTPAQRIREDWLARHKMSEDDLKTMDDKQREAVEKDIAEEIKRKLTGQDSQRGAVVNLSA